MYALTVWQPWAWAIGAGIKLVENRDWLPSWKLLKDGDDIAIHAGVHAPTKADYYAMRRAAKTMGVDPPPLSDQVFGATYGRGRIVAVVTFAGIARKREELTDAQRPWWVGTYGWLLSNVRQLDLSNAPKTLGQQGLWPLMPGVEHQLRGQLSVPPGHFWRKTA